MFDDQQNNPVGGVPNNLPIGEPVPLGQGEPDDIFSGVEKVVPEPPQMGGSVISETPVVGASSALGAGILRPKVQPVDSFASDMSGDLPPVLSQQPSTRIEQNIVQPSNMGNYNLDQQLPSQMAPQQDIYKIKEPALGSGLVKLFVTVVVLGILGGGSWWIYNSFIKSDNVSNDTVVDNGGEASDVVDTLPAEGKAVKVAEDTVPSDSNVVDTGLAGDIKDDQILFGEPIDKDSDGLDDDRELSIGTDPNNWDTDIDDLGDGDEVTIWKTDPLNPDTDGDTFLDGAEIKNGYNPAGPGKLFEPPK
ncbi:MAG TPA: hypothetical protein DEB09_05760 [Candidatus Magasanikbacteria bacterium]|nr:hypothetical protein [Candidatus Magasanikbacteria bacterium]